MITKTLTRLSASRKSLSLLTYGAVLIGATLNLGIISIIPNIVLQNAANAQKEQVSYQIIGHAESTQKIEEDKRFLAIEKDLKPWDDFAIEEGIYSESSAVKELNDKANAVFLHQFYPLIPGYANYMKALEEEDANSPVSTKILARLHLWAEFRSTCHMVDDLNAGLNLKDLGTYRVDETGAEVSAYEGEYLGGAGLTPENFTTYLKGCGDKDLQYLDELKEQNRAWETSMSEPYPVEEDVP